MKCFMSITSEEDRAKLQQDVDFIFYQSSLFHLTLNFTKCVHVPFKPTSNTRGIIIISTIEVECHDTQKDLGVVVSSVLKWVNQ